MDLNLIRRLLLEAERSEHTRREVQAEIQGYTAAQLTHYTRLLCHAGLVTAVTSRAPGGEAYLITGITPTGHELLEAVRNEVVWARVQKAIQEKGEDLTVDHLKQLPLIIHHMGNNQG